MQWLKDLKTGTKLSLSFGLIMVIMIIIIASSYSSIHQLQTTLKSFSENELILLEKISTFRDNQSDLQAHIMMYQTAKETDKLSEIKQHIKSKIQENDILTLQIMKLGQNDADFIRNFEIVNRLRQAVEDKQILEVVISSNDGVKQEKNSSLDTLMQDFDKLGNLTIGLISDIQKTTNNKIETTANLASRAATFSLILGLIAVIIVFILTISLKKLIINPLKEITEAAQAISNGDIIQTKITNIDRKDEVGVLAAAFLNMSEWLQSIAQTATYIAEGDLTIEPTEKSSKDILGKSLKTMVKNLRQITCEIYEAMNLLETSMNEISAATSQLVSSASETATAISETTTTIEEVKQTSRTANEKAKTISETSKKTNEISSAGNKAAVEMTDTTNQIKHQMQLIAESMLRLSEQSQAIGTIMATVEDMAQQSNLLSVNASIEAAKAGEQGKGFSIVAQEVKSLASQSKQATTEVRDILSDIQKATSSAVMATEQGSKSVELGVKKSEETGQSIGVLVKMATESARDAMQIAATTHQQLVGMEQAATAMENIKTATFQNVEGSKQLEGAASNIKELGLKLKTLISQYKIHKT